MTWYTWLGLGLGVLISITHLAVGWWVDHTETGLRAWLWWRKLMRPHPPRSRRR